MPAYALEALDVLNVGGFEAWFVGGCVRDALLKRPVSDIDITTNALWTDVEQLFSTRGYATRETGVKHGTLTVIVQDHPIEITTFRTDSSYADGRHPDKVTFVRNIEADLTRRDFTINALAYNPERGLIDSVGGLTDLENRTIRAIGEPYKRFNEDALRILRACRFSSQLGFSIEADTMLAMEKLKTTMCVLSSERVAKELEKLLLGPYVFDALMNTSSVLVAVLPELAGMIGFEQHTPYHLYDVWEHTAHVVEYSPQTSVSRWAALLHDCGKPAAFFMDGDRGHFFGHARLSIIIGREIMDRLRLPNALRSDVLKLVRYHDTQIQATTKSVRKALVMLDGDVELFRALTALKRADALAQAKTSSPRLQLAYDLDDVLDEVLASHEAFKLSDLAINGHDIVALGAKPGPCVGKYLNEALQAVINEKVPNDHGELTRFISERMEE